MSGKLSRILNIVAGLFFMAAIGFGLYAFGGAEMRARKMCDAITPGMTFADLKSLSVLNGYSSPRSESGMAYIVEKKSFGRWGCKVVLEYGVVKRSEYTFSD